MKFPFYPRLGAFSALTAILVTGVFVACSDDPDPVANKATVDAGDSGPQTAETGASCPAVPAAECGASKCTAKLGEPAACVDNACVKLKSASCIETYGAVDDDNAFVFGLNLFLTGDYAKDDAPLVAAVKLAVDEINAAGGVPVSTDTCVPKRKLGYIGCDDDIGDDGKSASATQLVGTLKRALFLGPDWSGGSLLYAKNHTMPGKVMQFSPSATSPLLTKPETNADPDKFNASPDGTRLLWRTAVSDAAQSVALNAMYGQVEADVKTAGVTAPKAAFLLRGDAYGRGMVTGFETGLKVNGATPVPYDPLAPVAGANYLKREFNPNLGSDLPDAGEGPELGQIVDELVAYKPNLIVLVGTAESVLILRRYEQKLKDASVALADKPRWLLVDGTRAPTLRDTVTDFPDLQSRIRGVVPGVPSQLASDFEVRFKKKFPDLDPRASGTSNSYDIVYSIALALATTKGAAVDGTTLAKAMANLVGGSTPVNFSPPGLTAAFQALNGGGKVKIAGVSGPLQFDLTTGEPTADYSIWCVKGGGAGFVFNDITGQTYVSADKQIKGTFSCN